MATYPTCSLSTTRYCETRDELEQCRSIQLPIDALEGHACGGHSVSLCDDRATVRFRIHEGDPLRYGQQYACAGHDHELSVKFAEWTRTEMEGQ